MLVRLLLDGDASGPVTGSEWDAFLRISVQNGVVIRAVERLRTLGAAVPAVASATAHAYRVRARAMLDAMARVGEFCDAHRIDWCLPRALQHLPDMGRDIDFLVDADGGRFDRLLRCELGALPVPHGLRSSIAGSSEYRLPGCPAVLDIRFRRLGVVGEDTRFAADLLRRCRTMDVGRRRFNVPRDEDRLVLQAMQRVYGRTGIRVADAVSSIALVRRGDLDWSAVLRRSATLGIAPGLSCYLSYLDRIHTELYGVPLPCPPIARNLIGAGWGRVRFDGDRYRFPVFAVNCRLYLARFASDAVRGRWASAGRLCLLPAVAVAAAGERAGRRLRRAAAAADDAAAEGSRA